MSASLSPETKSMICNVISAFTCYINKDMNLAQMKADIMESVGQDTDIVNHLLSSCATFE
jgi:hypothetical protein